MSEADTTAGAPQLHSTVTDTALIFEGGGMRAALTSAMVVRLLQEEIHFDWVTGISAGATNTANYLSRDERRARRCFVEFSADPNFGNMRTFLRGQGLFNSDYIYQGTSLPDQALPFDWETFAANPADFAVAALDVDTGAEKIWTRADIDTMSDLMRAVQASSTMPVVMPPVTIGDHTYVDGALAEHGGIPLPTAQRAGFEKFLIVLTQQRDYAKTPQRFPSFYRSYFRRYPAVADALLGRWKRYNAMREEVFELERQGKAYVFVPEVMPVGNSERNLSKLAAAHRMGLSQVRRELPAIREFLGLESR